MYARVHKATGEGGAEQLTLRRVAGREEIQVSLWDTREAAAAGPTAEWYEVEADQRMVPSGETASVAALLYLDGPMSEDLRAAARRANRNRIGPAMATRTLVLWQPDRRAQLAASLESIEDGQRRISAMEPLPGPDRIDLFRVVPNGGPVR
jgi:hypothetical protein